MSLLHVLLVEDSLINQQMASELLDQAGIRVSLANNGKEAVDKVLEGEEPDSFDLILMDIQMPEMDGFEATRQIRRKDGFKDLPIIGLSARALDEYERCLAAGMNDNVAKPINPMVLFSVMSRLLAEPIEPPGTGNGEEQEIAPDLPGLDTANGLLRVAGNKALYIKLLQRFVTVQRDMPGQIILALRNGDHGHAKRAAHGVAGVAGNIGANDLCFAAGRLEKVLQEGDGKEIESSMETFRDEMEITCQSIEHVLSHNSPPEAEETPEKNVGKEETVDVLKKLLALLEGYEGETIDYFKENRQVVKNAIADGDLPDLETAIGNFDFEKAAALLVQAANKEGIAAISSG